MLANSPVKRDDFFKKAGISVQCWWDWKRTDRISKHSQYRMSKAYKYFRSEEYKKKLLGELNGLLKPSSLTIEDHIAELGRKGVSIRLEATLGVVDGIKFLSEAVEETNRPKPTPNEPGTRFYKMVDGEFTMMVFSEPTSNLRRIAECDVACDKDKTVLFKNRYGLLEDTDILRDLE